MLLKLIAEPEAGETSDAFTSSVPMPVADFNRMLDMMGSIYDEAEPKQDSDANGLLWLDEAGKVLTQAQVDAANTPPAPVAPAAGAPGAPPAPTPSPVRVTPKYRPRTRAEIWFKVASGLTKGTLANANRRAEELARRAVAAPAPIAVNVPAAVASPAVNTKAP